LKTAIADRFLRLAELPTYPLDRLSRYAHLPAAARALGFSGLAPVTLDIIWSPRLRHPSRTRGAHRSLQIVVQLLMQQLVLRAPKRSQFSAPTPFSARFPLAARPGGCGDLIAAYCLGSKLSRNPLSYFRFLL
jgi:hypothetical protein